MPKKVLNSIFHCFFQKFFSLSSFFSKFFSDVQRFFKTFNIDILIEKSPLVFWTVNVSSVSSIEFMVISTFEFSELTVLAEYFANPSKKNTPRNFDIFGPRFLTQIIIFTKKFAKLTNLLVVGLKIESFFTFRDFGVSLRLSQLIVDKQWIVSIGVRSFSSDKSFVEILLKVDCFWVDL